MILIPGIHIPLPVSAVPTGIPATSIGAGSVDNTEFGYLNGVTSAIQTQLAATQPLDSTLTAISALADGAGELTNNGSGVLSWA